VLAFLIVLLFASAATAADVSATRLDGDTVTGNLKSWDDEFAVVETAEGEQRIAVKELLSLRWQAGTSDEQSRSATSGQVELIDGSVLPMSEIRSSASRANITLAGPASSHADTLTIAKRQIAAVRLQPLDAALVEQWDDIREIKPDADILVMLNEGQSLDYIEGVIGDVSPEKIAFELDGTTRKIDRNKVAGFVFFRRAEAQQPEPRFVIQGRSGLHANVASAALVEDVLRITMVGGTKLEWPLTDIEVADFSAGKLMYLSDLEPAVKSSTPLVALPDGTSLAGKYAEPRRDRSAYGGPLTVASGDDLASVTNAGVQTFQKGLAVRSRTELVYRLPAGFRRLNAIAGIDPVTRAGGHVRIEILGDDRPLLSTDISGSDAPRTIDLDIAGVKRLKFIVDYGKNLDTGDWLNLGDLRIVK
jgi:hypothetical protein